jgi:N utilization substance protein A
LSLAIGKEGQNARLAARLTGWKIDIKSISQMREKIDYASEPDGEENVDDGQDQEDSAADLRGVPKSKG